MAGPRKRLGELLVEAGVVDQHQLQAALGHQKQWGGKLGRILVEKRFITEDVMIKVLCRQLGLEAVDLQQLKVHERVIAMVPLEMATQFQITWSSVLIETEDGENRSMGLPTVTVVLAAWPASGTPRQNMTIKFKNCLFTTLLWFVLLMFVTAAALLEKCHSLP